MPRSLDLTRLRQFEVPPAPPPGIVAPMAEPAPAERLEAAAMPGRWPSREPVRDGQVSVKAPLDLIERFRRMCRDDRRTYADMLGILMDTYEGRR